MNIRNQVEELHSINKTRELRYQALSKKNWIFKSNLIETNS